MLSCAPRGFSSGSATKLGVEVAGCAGLVLDIGESCLLAIGTPDTPLSDSAPSDVLVVDVHLKGASVELAQRLPIPIGPLQIPPELTDQIAALSVKTETEAAAIVARLDILGTELVAAVDHRLQIFESSLAELRLAGEASSQALSDSILEAAAARAQLGADLTSLSDAGVETSLAVEDLRLQVGDVALLVSPPSSGRAFVDPATGLSDSAYLELVARVHQLEDQVALGAPPHLVGAAAGDSDPALCLPAC